MEILETPYSWQNFDLDREEERDRERKRERTREADKFIHLIIHPSILSCPVMCVLLTVGGQRSLVGQAMWWRLVLPIERGGG